MGTWGTGIFSDDLAADLQLDWRDLIAGGAGPEAATQQLLKQYADSIKDMDEAPVFWLALAAAQWRTGRLQPNVRAAALEVVSSGADLHRWTENPRQRAARMKVLEKLAAQLGSPQPAARPIRKPPQHVAEFPVGSVVSVSLNAELSVLLRVARHWLEAKNSHCVFEVLRWSGDRAPDPSQLRQLGSVPNPHPVTTKVVGLPGWVIPMVVGRKGYPGARLRLIAEDVFHERKETEGWPVYISWKAFMTSMLPQWLGVDPDRVDPF